MTLKGTPTKEEVVGVVLQKLDLDNSHRVLDVGCGSGRVSKEIAKIASEVIGIDRRKKAIEISEENCPECQFFHGKAKDLIPEHGLYDRVFIGGTKNIKEFFPRIVENIEKRGKIVANASRLEVALNIQRLMKDRNIHEDTILVQVSNYKELGGKTSFKPNKPVFMVVGKC